MLGERLGDPWDIRLAMEEWVVRMPMEDQVEKMWVRMVMKK
jgi:hypothetical protein